MSKAAATSAYAYLDRTDFRRHYAHPDNPNRVALRVDNVHCTSCLQRIEGLADKLPGVDRLRLDMGRHLLDVELQENGSLASVAARLDEMGYTPHPVAAADVRQYSTDHKSMLIRIGVAGAVTGNIMLLATSLYSGADHASIGPWFEWLTFFLFLPILFYAAVPFYKNSWSALRNRRASIDIPIAGAVIIGTIIGVINLTKGNGQVYFDSLAVLVFLLLSARFLLLKLQNRFLAPGHLRAFFETNRVRVRDLQTGVIEERHLSGVRPGDEIVIRRGERVPVDGELVRESRGDGGPREIYVDAAVLTGEAAPERVLPGEAVFAATMLMSEEATIVTRSIGADTRVGQLLEETERSVLTRTPLISLTDRAAQWFSASVFAVGVLFAIAYSFVDVHEALNRALALVILACPCALALATPLTQSLALRKAARRGCLIKNAEAFERLHQIDDVFFDKTGTLTTAELEIVEWWPSLPTAQERAVILALERRASHPVAPVLREAMESAGALVIDMENVEEVVGVGVAGDYDGKRWELGALREMARQDLHGGAATCVALYCDNRLRRIALLGDHIRPEAAAVVKEMIERGLHPNLLTGDAEGVAVHVAAMVGIPPSRVYARKSPEDKSRIVELRTRSVMIGDGVNDTVAMSKAHTSVAVHGSLEASFRAADIYLTEPGLRPLLDLFELSRATQTIIKRNLVFSLLYNLTGATLALLGFINPLIAAVLMPISSVAVLMSSSIGTRAWRRLGRTEASTGQAVPTVPVEQLRLVSTEER